MVKNGYISKKEAKKAYNEKLILYGKKEKLNLTTLMYYKDAVMNELYNLKVIPKDYIENNSIKIYTNLDLNAQTKLDNAIKNNVYDDDIELSSVMIENKTGKIIALTGGRDYEKSQFNRALYSKRQVGSTLKPFLYYTALENGFTPSSEFMSKKTTFNLGDSVYKPSNAGNIYANRKIPMILALAYSDNIYALKTNMFLGDTQFITTLNKVGINDVNNNVSLPLGTSEINIITLTSAYQILGNEGKKTNNYLIREIKSKDNNILYKSSDNSNQVLNNNYVYIMNELLRNCYDYQLTDYSTPTCLSIRPKITKKYAIKTGSTNTDSLIVGYNKDYTLGIWSGYDNNKELKNKDNSFSRNVWIDTMENYLRDKEDSWFDKPKDVNAVLVNPLNGRLATNESKKKKFIFYLKGTEPTEIDK